MQFAHFIPDVSDIQLIIESYHAGAFCFSGEVENIFNKFLQHKVDIRKNSQVGKISFFLL